MKNWMLLSCLAVVGGAVVVAHSQDPQFNVANLGPHLVGQDTPPADPTVQSTSDVKYVAGEPAVDYLTWADAPAPAAPQDGRKISVVFDNATPEQVSKWLVRQGYNLVIPSDQISKDKKLSLSLKNAPADEALDAIARALGGYWQKQGDVRVFQKGGRFAMGMAAPEARVFALDREGKALSAKDKAELEKLSAEMAELGGEIAKSFGPEFHKGMAKMLEGMPAMPALPPMAFKFDSKQMDEKAMKEWAKKMEAEGPKWEAWGEKFGKEMELKFGKDFGKDFEKKFGKDFEKRFEDVYGKNGEKIKIEIERHMKDAEKHLKDAEKHMKESEDVRIRIAPRVPGAPAAPGAPLAPRAFALGSTDMKSLAKSLSAEQRAKHKAQGFLKKSDLTPEQVKLLGGLPAGGKWTISYTVEDENVTIKSDE